MRILGFIVILFALALPAVNANATLRARLDAVECSNAMGDNDRLYLRIDRPFGVGSWWDADLYFYPREGASLHETYVVTADRFGLYELRFTGAKFNLVIDTFMNGGIRRFVRYDGVLNAEAVRAGETTKVICEFLPF